MSGITLVTATPAVHTTKSRLPSSVMVDVQAVDTESLLSLHYKLDGRDDPVPRVGERLLVAILGNCQWATDMPNALLPANQGEGEPIKLTLPSRSARLKPYALVLYQSTDHAHAVLDSRRNNEDGVTEAEVILDKEQVATLIAGLLGIYRRLVDA